jgi:integrase
MNDIMLGWKKIARGMARVRKAANDRAPTLEEIQRMIEYPDRRIKPIVHAMASSGIRIGAWEYLRWKHVLPITNDKGEIIALVLFGHL